MYDQLVKDKSAKSARSSDAARVMQRESYYKNTSQTYDYGTDEVQVGKKMEAWLHPNDMRQGQSSGLNVGQDEMMDTIRDVYGIKGNNVVKGHLLNDNLGGLALNDNLYPITGAANKNHLNYVENAVKQANWIQAKGLYYKVEVDANPTIDDPEADFDCVLKEWNPKTNDLGKDIIPPTSIPSDLEDVAGKGYHLAPFNTYTGEEVNPVKRPRKPKSALKPKTKVSELTKQEKEDRLSDMNND